jgi:hypothetical protein
MTTVSLTNRVDIIADSLFVFDNDGRLNIPLEIKNRATIDYVNEIRDDLKIDPDITGTLTVDDIVVNDDVMIKSNLKVDTISSFEAPQITIDDNLTITGSLIVGSSNIINALLTKANQITTYTKTETNEEIAKIVNGSPELLDTLFELSKAINDDQNFATTMADELATKATNIRVNEIRDALQTSITSTNTNLANNYYNRDVMDLYSTGFQNQINIDTNNLRTNYYTKTEITDIKTTLNNSDTSLQTQIRDDINNLSINYYTKEEVEAIKTTLNNTDISLQNTDVSLQDQITADEDNLLTNYFNKTDVNDKLILKENILDNNDKLFLKSNKADVYLKQETLSTEQFYDSLQAGIATRQTILLVGAPLNGEALLNGRTIKGVTVNTPLSLTSNSSSIIISSNTYSKEEINTALSLKSDSTNINASLLLKENITDNDAKLLLKENIIDNDAKLILKADITYTDSLNNLKADKTYVDNQLNLKESIINNDAKLVLKSDKTYVDNQLNLKESIINNDAKLVLKSDKTYVDNQLALKENITANDAKLLLKESIINNDAKLILKESIIDNDAKLALKANKTDVDAALVLKADKTNVDTLLSLKESIIDNDSKLVLKANKIYVDDQLILKESVINNDAKLLLKESIINNDAKLLLKESIINNDAKLLLKANKIYVDDQLALKESIINNDAKLLLKESIINNDAKLILKESIIDNDAKLLLKANKIYVDDQLALKESITDNDAKLILKENVTTNDAKLILKENITANDAKLLLKENILDNDAKLLLKESIINNDAKLLLKANKIYVDEQLALKEGITANDAKLLLKADKTYVDEQLATKETILNNNTKLSLKSDISYVDTLGTNLTYSINAGALNLSTNYYNKTSIDAIKTGIDLSLSNKADKSDTYTKAQVNTIQNNLATSLNNTNDYLNSTIDDLDDNYYTKTEIDTGYYSKTEIDTTFSNLIDSAPTNLDTLKEISLALNNDPNMYTTIQTQLAGKQNKFLLGELPLTNSARLFDLNSTKFRGIHCSHPLSIVETSQSYLTLDVDSYTKAQTDNLITTISLTPGQQGEKGDQGIQGIQGIKGDQGIQGIKGDQGIQGIKGDQGIQGIKGDQGIQGIQGIKGDQGIQGIQGIQGDKGDKGDKGDQGIQGIQGIKGDQGIQGIQGDKGDKGDQGIQGIQGIKGDQGIQGIQGDKGDKGDQGIQGIQGIKGDQGIQGIKGDQGIQGIKGDTGPAGIYTSGTSTLDSQAIISGSVIKNLKPGTAITLSSDDNSIIISGRDAYTKTESDTNYYYKSFIDNTASAWSSGLVSDFSHILSTGTNNLTIRSKTGTPFDIMRIYNTGIVNFTGLVMFDAEPQDITFATNGASYTLQDAFDFKQNSITAYTPTSSTQLFLQGADSGYMKALKAGAGITLSSDGTSVTVVGIDGYTKTEVTNSLALKANAASPVFTGNASVGGVLSVTGNSNLTGNLSVIRTAATGNGNVAITSTNNGNEGFSSLYLQTRNQISPMTDETAQIFVGQNSGMVLHTRSAHDIRFQTYSDEPLKTVTPSMKILGSGTRDVEIYTPLKINSSQTTFSGSPQNITFNNNNGTPSTLQAALTLKANAADVYTRTQTAATFQTKIDAFSAPLKFVVGPLVSTLSIDASSGVTLSDATITNSLTVGSLVVTGIMTVTGDGPWYCAGRVSSGGTGSISSNYGRVGFTLVRNGAGQVTITMNSAHPQGANYAVFASSSRAFTVVENNSSGAGIRTSSSFQISVRNSDFSTGSDTNGITFMVV